MEWLTERERGVLVQLMQGYTAEQIATAEFVTIATVRSHIRQILLKLGVNSQIAAVAYAYRVALIDEYSEVLTKIAI